MLLVATSALLGIYLTEAQVPQQLAAGACIDFTHEQVRRPGASSTSSS